MVVQADDQAVAQQRGGPPGLLGGQPGLVRRDPAELRGQLEAAEVLPAVR